MAANAIKADLAAAYFDEGSYDVAAMGFSGKKIAFSRRIFPKGHVLLPSKILSILRYLHFKIALVFKTSFLREYDVVIFSGDTLGAVGNCPKDARKICYFHSIPRYLFDQRDLYYSKVPKLLRPFYRVIRWFFEKAFFRELAKIDRIYVNGKNLQTYCSKYLNRASEILYPPVDTEEFFPCTPKEKGDYYLSFSKLATLKRVDAVVRAFREMPNQKLLVIYGANDPQKDEVLTLAAGAENIECRILSDNRELPNIVARAIATVFVSKNEDFGMVAIESMAAGTPVIAANS
jgi:glycosyltransferase involved in cell wall biosynthesis